MAVKARNRKKINMFNMISNSKKIACKHCALCGNCKTQQYKEKGEKMGIITYCSLTPDKEKSKKSNSKDKKKNVIKK